MAFLETAFARLPEVVIQHPATVPLPKGEPACPRDAVAHIYKPSRSPNTSGRARTKLWLLRFERRTPPYLEPLMGWTGGDDTLQQVELRFPDLESALAYAQRQGLSFRVHGSRMPAANGQAEGVANALTRLRSPVAAEVSHLRRSTVPERQLAEAA